MFQLDKTTPVVCTNINVRAEMHGKEMVRAIDKTFRLRGENTLLDLIEPGLRQHFYRNKAYEDAKAAGQELLVSDIDVPLPNLRYPLLPTEKQRWGDKKYRGYRWQWDWGTEESRYDFSDVAVGSIVIEELQEGGSVSILFTVQYNGEELDDNATFGELAGLPCMGEIYIRLFAPPELMAVKKGYRAGRPDTPQERAKDPNQQELAGDDGDGPTGDDDQDEDDALREAAGAVAEGEGSTDGLAAGSPEAALASTLDQDDATGGGVVIDTPPRASRGPARKRVD